MLWYDGGAGNGALMRIGTKALRLPLDFSAGLSQRSGGLLSRRCSLPHGP